MKAEIIAIGDELTSGQRVDTNSAWLSQRLGEIGIRVLHHSTVADDLPSCRNVFVTAFSRVDLVICTGGLGPTADDLTREVIADAMGVELKEDSAALAHIRDMFERRRREMPPRNAIQAMFPAGSRVVPNPHGTAPGIDVTVTASNDDSHKARCFALPGVPAEMKEMWHGTVLPALLQTGAGTRTIVHHELKCFGIGESECERRLPDLVRRGRKPSVGITVHKATITLRITADGADEAECQQQIQPTVDTIRECLGPIVFGEGNVTLHQVVMQELQRQNATVVCSEWGTSGILTGWLADAADEYRGVYLGGRVRDPSNDVDPSDVESLFSYAQQLRAEATADYALVIGDWHPPAVADGDAADQIHILLATKEETIQSIFPRTSHPDIVAELTVKRGLDKLRKCLQPRMEG